MAHPGKLTALERRFQEGTFSLFDVHGFRVALFGRDLRAADRLHYALLWRDLEEMEDRWAAFQADERWQELKRSSEAGGPLLVSVQSHVVAAEDGALRVA